jgi:DNA-directed RNA polymerase subunit RPC12/RpoP
MILTLDVQCLNNHKSIRRVAEHQVEDLAHDIFSRMYTCIDCGQDMMLLGIQSHGDVSEGMFLCPNHGTIIREFPTEYIAQVNLAGVDTDPYVSIRDSFRCSECGLVYAIGMIEDRAGVLELSVRCANGHKDTKYIATKVDSDFLKKVLQRVVHCDRCGLPGHISSVDERKADARLVCICPTHGESRKTVPSSLLSLLKEAVEEIPEDAVVRAMLTTSKCHRPLAIREIEDTSSGYKFRTLCPGNSSTGDFVVPMTWGERNIEVVAQAVLTCNECGLQTHILDAKKKKGMIEFRVVCPVHGAMPRLAPIDVFEHIRDASAGFDKMPSLIRSMNCPKCNLPLSLRDVEMKRDLVELDMDCRNGHRAKRFLVPKMNPDYLVGLYKNMFKCPECYEPVDLVYTKPSGKETRVVLLCPLHGKIILDVPDNHAKAFAKAYEELKEDRLRPRIEAAPAGEEVELDARTESEGIPLKQVDVLRGCEIIGGKFDFKVKVANNTDFVITNVTVSIVAYPQDCMEIGGENSKTISRIEVGGFRSPAFTFYPTKDCVQGKVVATVSYIDFRDQLHTLQVEPYLIRSVCDLLKPNKATSEQFDLILSGLTKADQEQTLEWNAKVLFTKAEKLLPAKNFHVIDTDEKIVGGEFIGTIRGFAEGKYTGKKVAIVFLITGPQNGRHATVKVEALGDDIAMLPTTIDELAETMDSWICLRCGAPLDPELVEELGRRVPVRCRYCSHTLTLGLYLM